MTCNKVPLPGGGVAIVCGPKKRKPAWPKTGDEMRAAGWKSSSKGTCRACPAQIVWATSPNGKATPLIQITPGMWQPHFIDCPARAQFRRNKK